MMSRSARRLTFALVVAFTAGVMPLFANVGNAATARHAVAIGPPPPPPAGGHIYFFCNWEGNWIRLKHIPNVPVEKLSDSGIVGQCQDLRTNDRPYLRLLGHTINVFVAPKEYPGFLVVHNGRQGRQPILGTWVFPLATAASSVVSGTVTDSSTKKVVKGATVEATLCIAKPTKHCTIESVVTNAKGAYQLQFFVFGTYRITVMAAGFVGGASVPLVVQKGRNRVLNLALVEKPSAVTMSIGETPSPLAVKSTATLTATIGASVNDGLVTFTGAGPGGASLAAITCAPLNGVCSVTWTPTTAGAWTITASWSGDSTFAAVENTLAVTVTLLNTTLTLGANPAAPSLGQTVALTATLGAAVSDGTVTFSGTGPAGATFTSQSCTPVAGVCSISWQPSASGTWSIMATWSGDAQYAAATNSRSVTVSGSTLTLALTASPQQPTTGQTVTLTVTLSQAANGGTVAFTGSGPGDAAFTPQTCTVVAGTCHVTWTAGAAGTWTLSATWSGNSQYPAATGPLTITVAAGSISIAAAESPNPLAAGQTGTLTATLTPAVSDGTVSFSFAGPNGATAPTKTCTPGSGTCHVTWSTTTTGTWAISAFWSGDSQYQAVVTTIQVTVGGTATNMTLTTMPTTLEINHTGIVTAQLASGAQGGTITLRFSGPSNATLASQICAPSSGSCYVQWTPNTTGSWTITANWPGGGNFGPASASVQVTVTASGYLVLTESPNPATVNQTVTLTARLGAGSGVGQVYFNGTGSNGGTLSKNCTLTQGACSVTFQPSITGVWTVQGFWSGDSNHTSSESDQVQFVVTGQSSTLTLTNSPSNPNINEQQTLTAVINHSVGDGSITFTGSGPGGAAFVPDSSPCTPVSGSCSTTWTPTVAGTWTVTATWSGDSQFNGASSTIHITEGNGLLTVSADPNPANAGQDESLTATLQVIPTGGTISFAGSGPSGQTLPAGLSCEPNGNTFCSVTWTPGSNAAGDWQITATWSGDSANPGGASAGIELTVNPAQFSLDVEPNPVPVGTQATVTATFTDTAINSGAVDFLFQGPNNTSDFQECTAPSAGVCSVNWTPTVVGSWTVSATWQGDATHGPATANEQVTVQ